MSHSPSVVLTDQEVLRRLQHLGDALAASAGHESATHLNPYRAARRSPGDWRQQTRLLEELAGLISDGVASRPAFVGWMSLYLKNAMLSLLPSQQTAVSRGCMAVLDCLVVRSSAAHRTAVAAVCSWFLTPLLRLAASPSSASVVSGTAACLLLSLASCCLVTLEGLNTIFTACAAVSAPVRRCAIHVLQTYLQAARGTSHQLATNAYAEALHRVLRDGVADADAEVRAGARRCFWTLHLLEPASAAVVLRTLPHNARRQLEEERDNTLQELQAVVAGAAEPSSTKGSAPSTRPSRSSRHVDAQTAMTAASRTVTLKDELQAAAASRARAQGSRSPSPSMARQQLLVLAKDLPYDPDRRPVTVGAASPALRGRHAGPPTSLLSSMESSDWSVRRAALLRARQLCAEDRLSDDLPSVMPVLFLRLRDAHFRVVEAAQELLQCCFRLRPSATQELLHESLAELMGIIVGNTAHAKPTVRDGAYVLLGVLARLHSSPAHLLEAVMCCVDDVHDEAAEQHGAEYLHYLVRVHFSLLTHQSIMGGVVRCCVAHLAGVQKKGRNGCRTAWSQVVAAAALASPDTFQSSYAHLSQEQQDAVRSALRDCLGVVPANSKSATEGAPELPCVFVEQLRLSCVAEKQRLSAIYRRSREPALGSADRDSAFSPPPLPATLPQRALPPFLRGLLATAGDDTEPSSDKTPSRNACKSQVTHEQEDATSEGPSSPAASPNAAAADASHLLTSKEAAFHSTAMASTVPQPMHGDDDIGSSCFTVLDKKDAAPPRNPPAHFLREWSACKEAAAKRAALLRLSSALSLYASRQRGGRGVNEGVPPDCLPEEVEHLLVLFEREGGGSDYGNDHLLRWAVFEALEALLAWPAARQAVTRQLSRVVALCRTGIDDAFVEVQLQAAACLEIALLKSRVPCDLCLGAVAGCLAKWMEGPAKDLASPGYVALLHVTRQLFEDSRHPGGVKLLKGGAEGQSTFVQETDGAALTLPASVLRRVTAVVCLCLGHCNPVVRLSAVLVLVAVQRTMGETTAAPFLTALTPAQHRVVAVYSAKAHSVENDVLY